MEKLKAAMWDEWTAVQNDSPHSASVEIGGSISALSSKIEGSFINFYSSRLFVFRRLKNLWGGSDWGQCGEFSSQLVIPAEMKGRVSLKIQKLPAWDLLKRFGGLQRTNQDSWNWIRGVFGACGSLFLPKTGYYMVFRLPATPAQSLEKNVSRVLKTSNISFRSRWRYGFREIVVRDQSTIVGMLSNMRLFRTSHILEEKAMLRSMRDRANKIVNCDASNIRRTIETAERQIQVAKVFFDNGSITALPGPLRDVIVTRIANPTATLRELGERLSRPVSKSTIEYRWRKIEQWAERENS